MYHVVLWLYAQVERHKMYHTVCISKSQFCGMNINFAECGRS